MKRFLAFILIALLLLPGCRQPRTATDPAALYHGAIEPDKVNLFFLAVGQGGGGSLYGGRIYVF